MKSTATVSSHYSTIQYCQVSTHSQNDEMARRWRNYDVDSCYRWGATIWYDM